MSLVYRVHLVFGCISQAFLHTIWICVTRFSACHHYINKILNIYMVALVFTGSWSSVHNWCNEWEIVQDRNLHRPLQGVCSFYTYVILLSHSCIEFSSLPCPIEFCCIGISSWFAHCTILWHYFRVLKASVIASAVFTLETYGFIRVEHSILFTATILILMYLRVSKVVLGTRDPFVPFENLICSVFFGGMWDALRRARSHEQLNGGGDSKVKKS